MLLGEVGLVARLHPLAAQPLLAIGGWALLLGSLSPVARGEALVATFSLLVGLLDALVAIQV